MKGFYNEQLKAFSRTVRVWSALAAWILIASGIMLFVLPLSTTLKTAALYGAAFGFILYGVYDFTNYAILKQYTPLMTLVDLLWGTTLCTISSLFAFLIK